MRFEMTDNIITRTYFKPELKIHLNKLIEQAYAAGTILGVKVNQKPQVLSNLRFLFQSGIEFYFAPEGGTTAVSVSGHKDKLLMAQICLLFGKFNNSPLYSSNPDDEIWNEAKAELTKYFNIDNLNIKINRI